MPWFDRALKSVQGTAEKAAFEADKIVRVRREEGALGDLHNQTQAKLAELGQAALALYRSGALTDPSCAALAGEIAGLEAQIEQQKAKVEVVRNEQWQPAEQQAPAAPPPTATAPPAERSAQLPPAAGAAAATVECPNCHTQVKSTAAFCPECGQKLR